MATGSAAAPAGNPVKNWISGSRVVVTKGNTGGLSGRMSPHRNAA
ncbi:MAG: hypothetical protein OEN02_09755 [Gammaproteobacteria bacterium]|nr:hypothetical protein [Gammaproteobacteria bacterium]MDH3535861.1 hypothetical protein [Gammaproteobacteria bacterium]